MEPFIKHAIRETLASGRGIIKISSLWMPLALIIQTTSMDDLQSGFIFSIYLMIAILCWSLACILVNDFEDKSADDLAGKERWISHLPKSAGLLIIITLVTIGFGIIVLARVDCGVIILYAAAVAIGFLYSLRPVRFKERGIFGLLAYSLSATICYVFVPWSMFNSRCKLLIILAFAVMLDKWVNLHFHQIIDYKADLFSKSRTYVVGVGLERARRSLKIATLLSSLSMIVALVFILLNEKDFTWRMIIFFTSLGVVSAVWVYANSLKKGGAIESALLVELPWTYLSLTYLIFRLLPPIIFIHLALLESLLWILVIISFISLLRESLLTIRYNYT